MALMKLTRLELTKDEKTVFRYHLLYSIIEGWIFGILALNEFVFLKSIMGSNIQLGLLFQLSMAVFVPLIFINAFIKRVHNKQALLRKTALS